MIEPEEMETVNNSTTDRFYPCMNIVKCFIDSIAPIVLESAIKFYTTRYPMKAALSLLLAGLLTMAAATAEARNYGDPLTLKTPTPVSAILKNPNAFIGKTVQVRGLVVEVCAKRGCWLYLSGDKPFQKIQIKVVDGVIVFPMNARGKMATVEGIVEKLEMTRQQALTFHRHMAEETGQKFDPKTVTGPEISYQIRGTGATVEGL